MWKDDRLRWKSEDVEAPAQTVPRPKALADKDKGGRRAGGGGGAGGGPMGHVSVRVWLLVAYLLVLHVAVMVSFTRETPDLAKLCSSEVVKAMAEHKVLPGR